MKQSIFILPLFFSLLLVASISAMEQESYQYDLSVARIDQDTFKVRMSKAGNAGKQSCSFVANFGAHTCDDQKDMFAPFDAAATHFDHATSGFFWNVPDFGLLKVLPDGSTFLGHHPDDTSLLHDTLTIETPAKLFLEALHVDVLNIKSKETQLCNAVVAKKISANHRVCNRGGLQIKELRGKGIFTNEARVEFKGTQEDPALLGIKLFQNRNRKHCTPTVHASALSIGNRNKEVFNGKDALFEVDELIIDEPSIQDALFHNKGVCKIDVGTMQRKIINEGLLQANALSARKALENKEFGHVKIFDKASIWKLDNDGQMDANRSLEMNFCTNKGTIVGSPDLAFRVRSVMRNHGQIRLRDLLGIGKYNGNALLYNYKELLFHDNGSIDGGYLINMGLVKGLGMRLSKTLIDNKKGARFELAKSIIDETRKITNEGEFRAHRCNIKEPIVNAGSGVFEVDELEANTIQNRGTLKTKSLHLHESLKNEQKGVVEVDKKSVIENAVIDNAADIELHGDIAFKSATVTNRGKMLFESGELSSADTQLHNEGDWLLRDVTSATPLNMTNKGTLELAQSLLHFARLQNDKDFILRSGIYTIDELKNRTLQLCDNNWAITDNPLLQYPDKLILKKSKVGKDPDLGEIACERDLLYDFDTLPLMLRSQANISSHDNRIRSIYDLQQGIETPGKVSVWITPIADGHLAFPTIGHLDLQVHGPLTIYDSLKAPTLSLHVQGPFMGGRNNGQLGTIAATDGPLTVNAHSIDGQFAKFYGKGKTLLQTTQSSITIGAASRGVDEGIKQQFINNLKSSRWYTPCSHIDKAIANVMGFNYCIDNYLATFDHTVDIPNGAYVASNDHITLRSATHVLVSCGALRSILGIDIFAPQLTRNYAGIISSYGPIQIEGNEYHHLQGGAINKPGWQPPPNFQAQVQYPSSVAATLASLKEVVFKVNAVYNRSSSIRSSTDIILRGLNLLNPARGYVEEPLSCSFYWASPHTGAHSYPALTQSCTLQAGHAIQMNLGNFVVTGNWNAPGVLMFARTGLFSNGGKLTRETKQIVGPVIVDLTKVVRQEAQHPGFYKVNAQGAIETEFPFGVPSVPRIEDLVALENPQYHTPLNWRTIFNPLSSINLDLHLQRLLSEIAGKVYPGNATVLFDNAKRWREEHGKEIMSPHELQHINRSMLLAQIARDDGMTEQQKTLLCIAPGDINPHQDTGVIVTDEFQCVTEGDQVHQNNQIIANGPGGIIIRSQAGDVKLETESRRTVYAGGDITVVEDHAYPQQGFFAPQGPVHTIAHRTIERTGTVIVAGQDVIEHAQTGSVIKNPLVLQKTVTEKEEDSGFFSSSEKVTTHVSHQIIPSTTIAGTHLHDQAGSSIHAVAPQDVAGQSITYQSPNTVIEGIILADSTQIESETSSMFSSQSRSETRETPCAMAATIRAPLVQFVGDQARVNANITAHELRDNTRDGVQFVAKVKEILYSQQMLADSPFMSLDAGCKGGYETMIAPMLLVDRIIRVSPIGQMLFESAIIDKDRTAIIGQFIETTYQLKKWHEEWCHKDQLVSDEMLVVIAAAIVIATQGMGAELLAPMLESAAATAMINAGFSTICASVGTSLARTGDPLQAIEQLGSSRFLKSLAFDVASAGLCSKLGGMLDINMAPGVVKPLVSHVQEHALRTTVDTLLNVAINNAPVGKSIGNAVAQISLKAIAGYVSNNICEFHLTSIERKAAHSLLGGAVGFAQGGNSKGFASGAVGALTAETVGTFLTEDAFAVSDAAIGRLKKDGQPLTQENIQKAVEKEVAYRMKFAKVASATVAAVAKLNPSIAMQTAANVTDNDIAIRAQIYALSEMQSLLTAASRAVTHLTVQPVSVSNSVRLAPEQSGQSEQPVQESKSSGKKRRKPEEAASVETGAAHNLVLHTIQKPANPYNDLIMECAQEWSVQDYIEEKKEKRSLFDRIVNPEMHPVIKETREIIRAAWQDALHKTIETYAMMPNPVGFACFAGETGRDLYLEQTTPGEVVFNTVLGWGILKSAQLTVRGMKALSQKSSEVVTNISDRLLSHFHQWRYRFEGRVPFVKNPRAGTWGSSEARVSGEFISSNFLSYVPHVEIQKNPLAPFNLIANGGPHDIWISGFGIHPKALSQANLKILIEEGQVTLGPIQVARFIYTHPEYYGQHINLTACRSGSASNGIAQLLATRMGKPVSAFTGRVVSKSDGSKFSTIISEEGKFRKFGVLKTFYPESSTLKTPKQLLPLLTFSALLLSGSERIDAQPVIDYVDVYPVKTYDDLMKEYEVTTYGQSTKQPRSLFDRIVNSEMHPVIKDKSKTMHTAKIFKISSNRSLGSRERKPFVEDPQAIYWDDACISSDLILDGRKDHPYFKLRSGWKKDKKCPFTVLAHGTPFSVIVDKPDVHPSVLSKENKNILRVKGQVHLNAKELKQAIENAPGYKEGQAVMLYSCNCGVGEEGIAQQLADEMNVPVSAFTGIVKTHHNTKTDAVWFTAADSKYGMDREELKTFYPRVPDANQMPDDTMAQPDEIDRDDHWESSFPLDSPGVLDHERDSKSND